MQQDSPLRFAVSHSPEIKYYNCSDRSDKTAKFAKGNDAGGIIIETKWPFEGSSRGRGEEVVRKREGGVLETRQIPRVGFSEDKGGQGGRDGSIA